MFDTNSRSFIDYLKTRQELVYGIVEADLAASTTLSLGFNMQKNKGDATTNAHLPALYSDGKVARLSRSTNAADKKFIPYAGITFDLDDRHTIYASYTDVFKPQAYSYDANDRQLDPLPPPAGPANFPLRRY